MSEFDSPVRYERAPEHDRRIGRGDDFAGDAWRDTATGEIRWVAVGHTPNEQEKREAPVLEMLAPDRDGMRVNIVGLQPCQSYRPGSVCRDGFPFSAVTACSGIVCPTCGRPDGRLSPCQREDLGPAWIDEDGFPRMAKLKPGRVGADTMREGGGDGPAPRSGSKSQ